MQDAGVASRGFGDGSARRLTVLGGGDLRGSRDEDSAGHDDDDGGCGRTRREWGLRAPMARRRLRASLDRCCA
ncbi:Os05g0510500 [Oryza sativa Japonica Group]|uniref:Os05g0510500 protein n=1 Tax=Oryza sativa subsp. japonica TaxID=39947 RepID=C7J2A7_ORYSJ|nr:Os05g0510500 [Oryza sativa Japonica Group]|eukprot:NP_001174484.1 Os05g0510500 [Oryza sativa Japonica Group]